MKKALSRFCLPTLVAVSAISFAAGPLTLRAKKGDKHTYHVTATLNVSGSEFKVTNDESDRVTAVDANGNITLTETEANMTVEEAGQKMSPTASAPRMHTYRRDGTFVSPVPATRVSKENMRAENVQTVKLPSFALAVGKTWTWDLASDAKTGAVRLHVAYKVLASERVAGVECWKISLTSRELDGKSPATLAGATWLRKSDALTVRMKIEFKNFPLPGAPAPVSGSVDQEMVS